MGGTLTYDKWQRGKSENQKILAGGGDFPDCKGMYPDCPAEPSLTDRNCRSCPKTDGLKKPKMSETICEFCGEEGVFFFKEESIEKDKPAKCVSCCKENSAEWIRKNFKA